MSMSLRAPDSPQNCRPCSAAPLADEIATGPVELLQLSQRRPFDVLPPRNAPTEEQSLRVCALEAFDCVPVDAGKRLRAAPTRTSIPITRLRAVNCTEFCTFNEEQAMGFSAADVVPLTQARANLSELADQAK